MERCGKARVGWLLDGSGEPARGTTTLTWAHGRITGVEPALAEAPLDDDTLDLRHCTALPALVDAHVHLFMEATEDSERREHQLHADYGDRRPQMAAHVQQHLAHGVAAVRDGGDYGGYALRYREQADPTALTIRAAGRAWRAKGRYGRLIGDPPPEGGSLAEAVRTDASAADHVKIAQSGLNSLKRFGWISRPQFTPEELDPAVEHAHARGRPVMVHANGPDAVASVIAAGCDSVEHGYFATLEVLKRAPDRGTVWVPTLAPMWAIANTDLVDEGARDIARRMLDHQLAQVADARGAGITLAAGSDAGGVGVHHGAGLWLELWLLARAGLSTPEVVSAATVAGARLLKLGPDRGTLKEGHTASWLAVPGAPDTLFSTPHNRPENVVLEGVTQSKKNI